MKRKSYKKQKNTSNHSMRRGKQRAGLSRNETKKMAIRAMNDGIDPAWTHGALYDELSTHYGTIRYYANNVYVFGGNGKLVTIMNIDPQYEKDLIQYVSYPVYVWYKNNRYKFKSDYQGLGNQVADAREYIKKEINEYLKCISRKVIDIYTKNRVGIVYIDPFKFEEISKDFKKDFKEKFGMSLDKFTSPQTKDIKDIREEKYNEKNAQKYLNDPIRKWEFVRYWFKLRLGLTIKYDYFANNCLIIRPTTAHDKSEITKDVINIFEKKFKYKIFVRNKPELYGEQVLVPSKFEVATNTLEWFKNQNIDVMVDDVFDEGVIISAITAMDIAKQTIIKEAFYEAFNRILVINNRYKYMERSNESISDT